jgi:hypothetical protein
MTAPVATESAVRSRSSVVNSEPLPVNDANLDTEFAKERFTDNQSILTRHADILLTFA